MSFVSTIIGTTERVPLPDLVVVEKEWRWSGTHYPCLWRGHSIVDAALALVLSRARRAVRLRRRQRMGREPLPDEGGVGRSSCAPKIER